MVYEGVSVATIRVQRIRVRVALHRAFREPLALVITTVAATLARGFVNLLPVLATASKALKSASRRWAVVALASASERLAEV